MPCLYHQHFFFLRKPAAAVAIAAGGVILGWPFAILAFLPVTIYSLYRRLNYAFVSGVVTSVTLLAFSLLVDHFYYKKWTSSVLNLLIYKFMGGGESHLYSTEGSTFYLRNGFNNFNLCFILALLFIAILPIAKKKYAPELFVIISPIYIWLAFMLLQPHKEERFLYPIYPLFVLLLQLSLRASLIFSGITTIPMIILYSLWTFSIINGYSAPLEI